MTKVNNFDVLKRMGELSKDIRLCTTVTDMTYNAKVGTKVTVGVPGNVCFEIESGKLSAFLLLFNKQEFDELLEMMQRKSPIDFACPRCSAPRGEVCMEDGT
jgi:hypothetical protein